MKTYIPKLIFYCGLFLWMGCSKNEFLNKKPNSSIIIPTTLAELRSMLDYTQVFTFSPGLGEMASDDYYLQPVNWQAIASVVERNSYTWESDLYGNQLSIADWSLPYQQILYANIVLEQLDKTKPGESEVREWTDIKGSALFKRALALSSLVQHFAAAFDSSTMNTAMGVPIRLTTDVKSYQPRNSMKECYDQIFTDLSMAAQLLSPVVPSVAKNRPSKPAAYALAARNALFTGQFEKAKNYADSALQLYNYLTDYNSISTTTVTPFDRSQPEILYYCQAISQYSILQTTSTTVFADTILYRSYNINDLRRAIFFRTISGSNMGFKRGYSGATLSFTGLATDEVYLIRAEALARLGLTNAALSDLNTLLQKRWKTGTFVPVTAINDTDALQKILGERRKELVWRGLRWHDLKRYNKQGLAIRLQRILGSDSYTLDPGSNKYVLPIPQDEISLSGIIQNPR
jgi:starch-binding outer membrane protein, SusD/RagB family